MIKIIEDLNPRKTKNIEADIERVVKRLNTIKENIKCNEEKYDLESLYCILSDIYDDIGDFAITVNGNSITDMQGII